MSPNNRLDLPYFEYFHADLLLSTEGWSSAEQMRYLWLLVHNWYHGPLPKSVKALAELCGEPLGTFKPMWNAHIRKKFVKVAGGFDNPRTARDRAEALTTRERRSTINRRNANSRYGNEPEHIGSRVLELAEKLKNPERRNK